MHTDQPTLDAFWDFNDPSGSEARFRAWLDNCPADATEARAEAMSQLARALGLQQRFEEAHAVLDEAEGLLRERAATRAGVRILLERGRAFRSAGDPENAKRCFESAHGAAERLDEPYFAVDTLHMLAIAATGEEAVDLNRRAIAAAEATTDSRARKWCGSLWNNLGWSLHDLGRYEKAKEAFEAHLVIRREQGNEEQAAIAQWSIAKMLRLLGRREEALRILEPLLAHPARQGNDAEGYTREEIANCLHELDRGEEARPHFARAWTLLRDDIWLARDEPARLERLRVLGGM